MIPWELWVTLGVVLFGSCALLYLLRPEGAPAWLEATALAWALTFGIYLARMIWMGREAFMVLP